MKNNESRWIFALKPLDGNAAYKILSLAHIECYPKTVWLAGIFILILFDLKDRHFQSPGLLLKYPQQTGLGRDKARAGNSNSWATSYCLPGVH